MTIETKPDAVERMVAAETDDPVVMLDLLRYRVQAEDGHGVDGMTGQAAYREYGKRIAELNPRFGGEPIWMGRAGDLVIDDEEWDIVILVRESAWQRAEGRPKLRIPVFATAFT